MINTAASWYEEFLGREELHSPEMDEATWDAEARRMTWWGAFVGGLLVGVMGCEPAGDAVLMRHAYVLPEYQRNGIGTALLVHSEETLPVPVRIVVGTYAANYKARGNLEKAGYRPSAKSETVLSKYYDIPEDRISTSIVYEKVLPA
ncbi:MAG: GNAT family N-acetyltransferase [bacterium]|nr:GNAT family N-acetyltransferase [bacterium]